MYLRQPFDNDGTPLVSVYEIESRHAHLHLILHSAGGAGRKGGVPRNRDYPRALEVLLERLKALDAAITDAVVDSTTVASLSVDQRRLQLRDHLYPVRLRAETDTDALRRSLTRAQGPVGRLPSARPSSGNERKRIRLTIAVPGYAATDRDARRLEVGLASVGASAAVETSGRGVRGGQGYMLDTASRTAVEQLAMRAATDHYRHNGWTVVDVSTTRSYDLHCTRSDEVRHVEVKGTTTSGGHVLLTPNEVALAVTQPSRAALYVLSDVVVTTAESSPVTASGGTAVALDPWTLDPERLSPTGYTYSLDG
jgi:hypothetical protein